MGEARRPETPAWVGAISVVMPTFNRAEMLRQVLPSYLQSPSVGEVVVVDDGSRDDTAAVLEGFSQRDPRVKPLRHPANRGMTHARNTGIEHATGEWVLFSEDDLAIGSHALEILWAHMEESGADIIAGRRIWMRLGESEVDAVARASQRRWPVVSKRLLEHYSHALTETDVEAPLVNSTMLVHRRVLDRVRFADCYPGNAWREESDFQISAQELGFRVFFCPHALFYHHDRAMAGFGRNRLKSDMRYLYWIFRNNITFLRRHRPYLQKAIPEAVILGSPLLTSIVYIMYRTALLAQTEGRRVWHLRSKAANGRP